MIEVYSKQDCPACTKWKPIIRKLCDELCLKLTEYDITENEEMKSELKFMGVKALPATIIRKEGCFGENYFKIFLNNLSLDSSWCEWK